MHLSKHSCFMQIFSSGYEILKTQQFKRIYEFTTNSFRFVNKFLACDTAFNVFTTLLADMARSYFFPSQYLFLCGFSLRLALINNSFTLQTSLFCSFCSSAEKIIPVTSRRVHRGLNHGSKECYSNSNRNSRCAKEDFRQRRETPRETNRVD